MSISYTKNYRRFQELYQTAKLTILGCYHFGPFPVQNWKTCWNEILAFLSTDVHG